MVSTTALGREGENAALAYLKGKGYTISNTNYRFKHTEIDIIATKGDTLAIIEVKTRQTDYFGSPESFVSKAQEKRIIQAANQYIIEHNLDVNARFDVIAITKQNEKLDLKHIKNAFYPF